MSKSLEFTGRVTFISEVQSGTSQKGEWQKQSVVIQEDGDHPQTLLVDVFNKPDEIKKLAIGREVKAFFNLSARQYDGKWYGQNNLWKFEAVGNAQSEYQNSAPQQYPVDKPQPSGTELPF